MSFEFIKKKTIVQVEKRCSRGNDRKERRRRVTISWGCPSAVCGHKRINFSRKFIGKIG
jgi:hypothetical protein